MANGGACASKIWSSWACKCPWYVRRADKLGCVPGRELSQDTGSRDEVLCFCANSWHIHITHDCLPRRLGAFDHIHEGTKCRRAPNSSSHLCTPEKFDRGGAEAAVTMRNPDFCYELDDFMLSSPSHRPTHHSRANSAIFKVRDFACFCGSKYVPSM